MTVWPGEMGKIGKWSGLDTLRRKNQQGFMTLGCAREGEVQYDPCVVSLEAGQTCP